MKKYIFSLAVLLVFLGCINISCYSQKKSTTSSMDNKITKKNKKCCKGMSKTSSIIIDALDGSSDRNYIPECIPENSILSIKVFNVNPYSTNLRASGNTSMIDFGNDSLLTFNFTQNSVPNPAPKEPQKKIHKPGVIGTAEKKTPNYDTIKTCSKIFLNALDQLTLLDRTVKQLRVLFDTVFITKDIFAKQMWSTLQCIGISNDCEDPSKTDSCRNCSAHGKYKELYNSLYSSYECIKREYDLGSSAKKAETYSLSGKLLDNEKGLTIEIKNAKGTVDLKKDDQLTSFFDNITTIFKKATSDSVKSALLHGAEYIDDCISKLCNDTSTQFFQQSYIKGPIEGDYITGAPFIRKQNGDTITIKDFPIYKIKICGGQRANVSTGISFSFFGLTDDDYSIARSNTDSEFVIKKTTTGASLYIPSLATFVHFYQRTCRSLQSAATMGLSVNPTDLESLKVMAGYSLIFGEKRRGIFSIGAIAGAVNRLKTKYQTGAKLLYTDYPGLQETDLVEKRFRLGVFVGLSYNLSKLR